MITTTRMKHLVAIILDRDLELATKELMRASLLHFVRVTEIISMRKDILAPVVPPLSLTKIVELRQRIETFLKMDNIPFTTHTELELTHFRQIKLEDIEQLLNKLAAQIESGRERQKFIQQEIAKLEDIQRQINLFGDIQTSLKARSHYSFLDIQTGMINSSLFANFEKAMRELPSVVINYQQKEGKVYILLITIKRDQTRVNSILDKFGWLEVILEKEIPTGKGDVLSSLEQKILTYRTEQETLGKEIKNIIEEKRDELSSLWENLRLNELYSKIQSFFSKTTRTVLFSGWLPVAKQKLLEQIIHKVTKNQCYLEWSSPEDLEHREHKHIKVPVELKNPLILSPFQMLVKNFSLPEYGTVDPTLFVAFAYLCMFGLMFADVGQGLIIALAGFLGYFLYRKKDQGYCNLLKLIGYCGVTATVAGFLFGSYFGMSLLPPLWFDYHGIVTGNVHGTGFVKDIYGVLMLTLYFGIGVICLGLVLNWINCIRKRELFKLFFGKGGLAGSWFYFGGIYSAFYFMTNSSVLPPPIILFFALGIPTILFLIKPVLEFSISRTHDSKKHFTLLTPVKFLMEWVVEMLEVFSGYLANTLSFMRVAGLGIAHVSLMMAFFEIARLAGGGVFAIIILILGNVFVIVLEGLSAGIQSLRLNYYEFFSKYFSRGEEAYAPITLKSHEI